jgi:hypothetical protein
MNQGASQYSAKTVKNAGKYLAGVIPPEKAQQAAPHFATAHEWRKSHIGPMKTVRMELAGKVRKSKFDAPTAARLKRMVSIRGKLTKGTVRLHDMQDVAGCRVILADMKQVNELGDLYRTGQCKHRLVKVYDYIEKPKSDGYRCLHLIFKPECPPEKQGYRGQQVEMQIRTQLQHAWATSVEAVGLYLGEDLKGGSGSKDWLRFFELMSTELAVEEGLAIVPTTPACPKERQTELLKIGKQVNALATLDAINKAVKYTEDPKHEDAEFFLIQYDQTNTTVTVKRYSEYATVSDQYFKAEALERDEKDMKTVLVAADAIEELKAAYPNYFLDVNAFLERVTRVLG